MVALNNRLFLLSMIPFFLASVPSHAQYQPSEDNIKSRKEFSDCKFGIFLHWGIYSMFGQGEWYMNDAAINALLLWIGDIPSLTAEHRLIYRQDQDKVNAYKEWKSLMRKQFSTSKEKHGSYDAAAIAEEIRTTIKSIMVPKIE